jgi:bifunctional DNase/RNase
VIVIDDKQAMIEAEIWTITELDYGNAVLLRPFGDELPVIPIFIGPPEAQSILTGYEHILSERPLTHDLFLSFMEKAGFTMLKMEVSDLRDNIFYGRVYFCGPNYPAQAPLALDARPSDALAMAVRTGCPILIARKVLEQAGVMPGVVSGFSEINISGPALSVKTAKGETIQSLKQELNRAVEAEEYEQAAKIRDRLIILTNGKTERW